MLAHGTVALDGLSNALEDRGHDLSSDLGTARAMRSRRRSAYSAGNVHTSDTIGVNARARTGSPVPIGAEPFRQGREHGHRHFWSLLQYGV